MHWPSGPGRPGPLGQVPGGTTANGQDDIDLEPAEPWNPTSTP
jgi:hypothetical protein